MVLKSIFDLSNEDKLEYDENVFADIVKDKIKKEILKIISHECEFLNKSGYVLRELNIKITDSQYYDEDLNKHQIESVTCKLYRR